MTVKANSFVLILYKLKLLCDVKVEMLYITIIEYYTQKLFTTVHARICTVRCSSSYAPA